ncbi:metallophosphoesterase family protein [Guptibacillus algicola]|uniref:metallophosphoesterase family protein n=1 Tax=Guptibacillus algicola TaxID=225844 RepID=UPI001CD53CD7|nr:DNA repair exonuclease [Alkalihalobacillus algicola]MCA0989202.1 DNA repair exonuclease [Alkalihalobacillus algicola]
MKKLSFLHCADLHLDRPFSGAQSLPPDIHNFVKDSAYRSFRRIIDLAIEESVDFVLFAGDLFDSSYRSLQSQMVLYRELQRLDKAGIRSFLSHGNHDALDGDWISIDWPESSYFFGQEVESVPFYRDQQKLADIHGFSYPERHVIENMSIYYERTDDESFQIGMLHGNVEGNTDHASYAPFTISDLVNKNFDYWALGHIHIRKRLAEDPPIVYPGNIQGAHRKETGEKGCYLVLMNEAEVMTSFHSTADVIWQKESIDISKVETIQDLLRTCEDILNHEKYSSGGHLVEFEFKGISSLHIHLLQDDVLDDLLQALQIGKEDELSGFVWPYKLSLQSRPSWNREELKAQDGFLQDLLSISDAYKVEDVESEVAPLYEHRRAKKALASLEEPSTVIKEAEELLLSYLVDDKGGKS